MILFLIQTMLDAVISSDRYFVSYTTRHFDIIRYSDKPNYTHLQFSNTHDSAHNIDSQSMYPKHSVPYFQRQDDLNNSSFVSKSNPIKSNYSISENPVQKDFLTSENDFETLLTDINQKSIQEPSYDDLNDFMSFLNNIDSSVSSTHTISIKEMNDTDRRSNDDKIEEYIDSLYKKIMRHIKNSIAISYHSKYLNRLVKINKSIKSARNHNLYDTRMVFTADLNIIYINLLRNLHSKYENRLILDDKTYKSFSHDLDLALLELQKTACYVDNLIGRLIHHGLFLLLNEFMKFYKYLEEISELLTLGYVATQQQFGKNVVIFHLINLFVKQNKGSLIEKKVFVIFLIKKSFSYTVKHRINVISNCQVQKSLSTVHSDLNFFCLEFGHDQREKIRKRKIAKDDLIYDIIDKDRRHYDIVLYLFLYQHFIFLRCHDLPYKEFEEFKMFIDKTMRSHVCYGCQFKRYISLVTQQVNNVS